MSSVTNNSTAIACAICREDYKKNEAENFLEVLELSCGHSFHVTCLEPGDRVTDILPTSSYREAFDFSRANRRLCDYCKQPSGYFPLEGAKFDVKSALPFYLEDLEKEYGYDEEVLSIIRYIRGVHKIPTEDFGNSGALFATFIGVYRNIKTLGSLRSIRGEAIRWLGITSLDQYPLALRERGVSVITKAGHVQVSVRYLDRAVRQIRKEKEEQPTPQDDPNELRETSEKVLDLLLKYLSPEVAPPQIS